MRAANSGTTPQLLKLLVLAAALVSAAAGAPGNVATAPSPKLEAIAAAAAPVSGAFCQTTLLTGSRLAASRTPPAQTSLPLKSAHPSQQGLITTQFAAPATVEQDVDAIPGASTSDDAALAWRYYDKLALTSPPDGESVLLVRVSLPCPNASAAGSHCTT